MILTIPNCNKQIKKLANVKLSSLFYDIKVDHVTRVNNAIRNHPLDAHHYQQIRQILEEAFQEVDRKRVVGSLNPTTSDSSASQSQESVKTRN